jgi:hypothetical protein
MTAQWGRFHLHRGRRPKPFTKTATEAFDWHVPAPRIADDFDIVLDGA